MKIALISTGLGNVYRGYERFIYDLFHLIKKDVDVTLFKGAGESNDQEVVIPHFKRDGFLSKLPLIKSSKSRNPYYFEALSFFISLLSHLKKNKYDIVHFADYSLVNFIYHFRTKLGFDFQFKSILTNGNGILDPALHRVDFLHQLTPAQIEKMTNYGIEQDKLGMIPFGIHFNNFDLSTKNTDDLKLKYGIPLNKKIILSVSAINKIHKRVDYLIEEVSRLGDDYYLVVLGHLEDESLVALAESKLGKNYKFMHLPFNEAHLVYSCADLFTLCSLEEGFGLVILEAMAARIPVVLHRSPHSEWILGDKKSLVDLSLKGALADKIKGVLAMPLESLDVEQDYDRAFQRFDWNNLKKDYLNMYKNLVEPREKVLV